jgi:hypothetical protein
MRKPHGYTGWIDLDRPRLRNAPLPERIDWFEYRVNLVVIQPLAHILDTQITADPDSSALLIAGVSLCSAIEATGKFITGTTTPKGKPILNNLRFERFVTDYMSPDLIHKSIGRRSYATIIWQDFRNGLAHGFAVCKGGFNGNRGEPYFGVNPDGSLNVNPAVFFDDFVQGFGRYVADIRAGSPKVSTFEDVFESVFILGQ